MYLVNYLELDVEKGDDILSCGLRQWLGSFVDQVVTTSTLDEIKAFQIAALALDIPLLLAIANKAYSEALRISWEQSVAHMPAQLRNEFLCRTTIEMLLKKGHS